MFSRAVVSDEINRVIDFFPTRWQAERMVGEALRDEPDWRTILRVEKIEFRTGTAKLAAFVPSSFGLGHCRMRLDISPGRSETLGSPADKGGPR
jgi:hypothetical protein